MQEYIIVYIDDVSQIGEIGIYIYKQCRTRAYIKITMEDSFIQLNDLPDEILLTIMKKLYNSDVLYSLIGVNRRLNTIVQDSIFTSYLKLLPPINGLDEFTDSMLDRYCFEVLPEIHHKIEWLSFKSLHMERILLATNYPKLQGLSLCELTSEAARDLFTGKTFSSFLSTIIYMKLQK